MSDDTLQRLEAMVVNLRDQLDHLTERLETRLEAQQTTLRRLEARLDGRRSLALKPGDASRVLGQPQELG
jgi:hypothetical protein